MSDATVLDLRWRYALAWASTQDRRGRYYTPERPRERCPLCRLRVSDRYEHLVTDHGWKRAGEVFNNGEAA